VQFKVRVIPDLVDILGIQNYEKTAMNFTKGFVFTRAWASATRRPMRGDRRFRGIRGIRGVFNSLTRTSAPINSLPIAPVLAYNVRLKVSAFQGKAPGFS
jgi:hypothetical protein